MLKKYYELQKWDITVMQWEEFVFQKMDWMYAQWLDKDWDIHIWHYNEYEQKEDSKWYPVID